MRLAEKKLFSRDENDNSDIVQSSPKGKFVPFEKKNTYIGIKTVEDINNMKENFEFSFEISKFIIDTVIHDSKYNYPAHIIPGYVWGHINWQPYNMGQTVYLKNISKFNKPVKNLEEANNADGKIWGRLTEDLENDIEILKEDLEITEA